MKEQTKVKITFNSLRDMPHGCVSIGDMSWNQTGTWRYMRPIYMNRTAPCITGCPTASPIERWIYLMEKGRMEEALEVLRIESPFPAIMGRVCFHPCEKKCNRGNMDGSVSINALERHLGDATRMVGAAKAHEVPAPYRPLRVAVIGSGPSGLACAYHLSRLGHKAVVFERLSQPGGMMRYGIPSYRLPREVLDREIDRFKDMGIEFIMNTAPSPIDLLKDFDKVYVAFGAQRSRPLGVPGDNAKGVKSGLRFLMQTSTGEITTVPETVLVIGGGNTAIDCARVALRLGAKDVIILYRRTEKEMPAFELEVAQARQEGVKIEFLVAPIAVKEKALNLEMICTRMKLGDVGPDGRRQPIPIEGSEFIINAGLILSAIGEEAEVDLAQGLLCKKGLIVVDKGTRTNIEDIYAGGDVTDNPRTVVDAIGMGKRAAIAMDCAQRGLVFEDCLPFITIPDGNGISMKAYLNILLHGLKKIEPLPEVASFEKMNTAWFLARKPRKRPELVLEERLKNDKGRFPEVIQDLEEGEAEAEAMRCMHCGFCIECDNCYIFCPDACIEPLEHGYEIDYYHCKGCGLCVKECPRSAMNMVYEKRGE